MYWLILFRPYSPSRWSAWSCGTTPVISCMMIEALMYGFTPRATTEKLESPPPDSRSRTPKRALFWRYWASCGLVDARHRHVGQEPEDDEDPEDVEQPPTDVGRAERVEERLEHGGYASSPGAALSDSVSSPVTGSASDASATASGASAGSSAAAVSASSVSAVSAALAFRAGFAFAGASAAGLGVGAASAGSVGRRRGLRLRAGLRGLAGLRRLRLGLGLGGVGVAASARVDLAVSRGATIGGPARRGPAGRRARRPHRGRGGSRPGPRAR